MEKLFSFQVPARGELDAYPIFILKNLSIDVRKFQYFLFSPQMPSYHISTCTQVNITKWTWKAQVYLHIAHFQI